MKQRDGGLFSLCFCCYSVLEEGRVNEVGIAQVKCMR